MPPTYAVLDGAGHNVHLDQPGLVHALFTRWLDELDARRVDLPLAQA
ncbi:hypothetical protein [Streptomyces sp. HUAS TT7]